MSAAPSGTENTSGGTQAGPKLYTVSMKVACIPCSIGKRSCSGTQPCERCARLGKECTYVDIFQRRSRGQLRIHQRVDGPSSSSSSSSSASSSSSSNVPIDPSSTTYPDYSSVNREPSTHRTNSNGNPQPSLSLSSSPNPAIPRIIGLQIAPSTVPQTVSSEKKIFPNFGRICDQ